MSESVTSDREAGVVRLTIRRPEQMNAISTGVVDDLQRHLADIAARPDDRVVVLTGAGRAFCAGADLIEAEGLIGDPAAFRRWLLSWREAFRALETCPKPVIAAVQGLALAGGLELALSCDVIVASDRATLGDVHARYGLVPGGGGSQRLPDAVGTRRARWLMYTGATLTAAEAADWGLVQQVFPADGFEARVAELAAAMAARSQPSLAFMKRTTASRLVDDRGLDLEIEAAVHVLAGPDAVEGLAAFREKREPAFRSTL